MPRPALPKPARPLRIYVSHDLADRAFAGRINAWEWTNPTADPSSDAPPDAGPESEALAAALAAADVFVCLIGEDTYRHARQAWEIAAARAARRGLVAVRIQAYHLAPDGLSDCGAIFVPFKRDAVERAILWAADEYRAKGDFTLVDD